MSTGIKSLRWLPRIRWQNAMPSDRSMSRRTRSTGVLARISSPAAAPLAPMTGYNHFGYDRTMKQIFLAALALATAFAAPLDQGERDRAMSHLHATRKMFLDSVAGLSDTQWNFKPAPERWSVAECAEHIAV